MDSRIKERLTGALILVAALVILVPEIFSGRRATERAQEAPPAAPASDGPPLRTYTSELGAAAPPPFSSAPAASEAPPAPPAAQANPPPASPPPAARPPAQAAQTAHATDTPAAPPASAPPSRSANTAGEWYVQVGSFSQGANAQKYAQQLKAQGYTAIVLPPGGTISLSRVRVGPVNTREAAASLQQRLASAGHKGALVGP